LIVVFPSHRFLNHLGCSEFKTNAIFGFPTLENP
jgi:hypothetical protein